MRMERIKWAGPLLILLCLGAAGCTGNDDGEPKANETAAVRTYTNPISLPDEWGEYGLGDPFVFSYNGTYYLYVSTRDTDAGVKVWSSGNLVDWKYEGLCTEDPLTTAAYAPEVRYWNGKFYMYTSPAGQGHYALVADKPTGPFKVATDNFGRTIDGTTFVDDDGQWYFYYAGPMGIQASKMTDPLTVAPEEEQTGAYMGGWTEGPAVFKRHDKYYMTYTGNHVFSAGYRVDAAVSTSPVQDFAGQPNDPVLLRTEGATVGLGHNSIVTGPDLDTQYMVYHNLEGHGVVGPLRHMNLDRIVWDGDMLQVAGPTSTKQAVPALPAFADRFDRQKLGKGWIKAGDAKWAIDGGGKGLSVNGAGTSGLSILASKAKTADSYTAEYHVRLQSAEQGKAGIVFSYTDKNNYGIATWSAADGKLEARYVKGGKEAMKASASVPGNLDLGQLQTLRVEKAGSALTVYAEGMKLLATELPAEAGAGAVGYAAGNADASFGYIAFSNSVDGSSAGLAYAPLPGRVNAFQDDGGLALANGLKDDGAGGLAASKLDASKPLTYRVNVAEGGVYSFDFRVSAGKQDASFRLTEDGKPVIGDLAVKPGADGGAWQTVSAHGIRLAAGNHRLTLEIVRGTIDAAWFAVSPYTTVTAKTDDFGVKFIPGWTRYEGIWSVKDGQLRVTSDEDGKILTGEDGWTNYTVEADATVPDDGGMTGILVRVTEPANGMELNQNRNDFLRGYFAYVDGQGVHLAKHDYDTTPLADAKTTLPKPGEKVHLKVTAVGNAIDVYAGAGDEPLIRYVDHSDSAFLHGRVGLKSVGGGARFSRFRVVPAP